jgi:hypothetical protein
MRVAVFLLAFVTLLPALWSVTVRAATSSECSAYIDAFAKDLETNTKVADDFASPYSPSPDHVAQSAARYNRDVNYSKLCPSSRPMYADALLATWKAWLEHATTHDYPEATTELAARKLQKCAVTYRATDDGATCAAWQKQVAKWQNDWVSP